MKTRACTVVLFVIVAGLVLASCGVPTTNTGASTSGGAVAIVNGTSISQAVYDKQVKLVQDSMVQQGLDLATPDGQATVNQMKQDLLDEIIDMELMRQAAAAQGITVTDADVDARVEQTRQDAGGDAAFQTALKQAGLTEADYRDLIVRDQIVYERLYAQISKTVPTSAEQVHVRHILVNTQQEADDVKARLANGEDFAALAQELSQDPGSKDSGGDLGFFPRGMMDPAFEDAAFSATISDTVIVQTDFGFHVLQVLEKSDNKDLSADAQQALGDEAMSTYLDDLRTKATIEQLLVLPPTPAPPGP
jgi:parvulin-like peptidyl-prolyl isomerase